MDFLLTAKRDKKAALRFLSKAIGNNGKSSLINIDKSGANTAAIKQDRNLFPSRLDATEPPLEIHNQPCQKLAWKYHSL
ncbi:DDE-type integrase/transposase/recombinase [Pseudomaricurvus alkylphenolicus]|nr:DDE-type integrase/transposase/recombinase [Pseudomaricurvus alkylphenolicus]